MNKMKKKGKKGFTLIELVVVIAILGILAAILIPVIGGFITRANIAKDQANARSLYNSIAMFLATDSTDTTYSGLLNDTNGTAIYNGILPLFGPPDAVISTVINDDVVEQATYNGVTYFRTASESGFS